MNINNIIKNITKDRYDVLKKVSNKRIFHVHAVFENVVKLHNLFGCIRTCEILGIQNLHFVKNNDTHLAPQAIVAKDLMDLFRDNNLNSYIKDEDKNNSKEKRKIIKYGRKMFENELDQSVNFIKKTHNLLYGSDVLYGYFNDVLVREDNLAENRYSRSSKKYKKMNFKKISKGSDKWLNIMTYDSNEDFFDCVNKSDVKKRFVLSDISDTSKPIEEMFVNLNPDEKEKDEDSNDEGDNNIGMDLNHHNALCIVFGCEISGISKDFKDNLIEYERKHFDKLEKLDNNDTDDKKYDMLDYFNIEMVGMTQSFNISVSLSITLYHLKINGWLDSKLFYTSDANEFSYSFSSPTISKSTSTIKENKSKKRGYYNEIIAIKEQQTREILLFTYLLLNSNFSGDSIRTYIQKFKENYPEYSKILRDFEH
eukprot:TRINITY_DN7509_c4_g1_i1.p1 TRINITY_DN7509_c4_g1~~TRINITY_DN7509_c4_g1_i1.p1  ORF type:complete len:424 (-),score=79.82 TRINITY_DN7509_c4_g1_i1:133-1404(-)